MWRAIDRSDKTDSFCFLRGIFHRHDVLDQVPLRHDKVEETVAEDRVRGQDPAVQRADDADRANILARREPDKEPQFQSTQRNETPGRSYPASLD